MKLNEKQRGIIPSIEEMVKERDFVTYEIKENDILVHAEKLPYSFTFSYFERYGWQAFLTPKKSLVEDDFSYALYHELQSVADSYNSSLRFTQHPELTLFPL